MCLNMFFLFFLLLYFVTFVTCFVLTKGWLTRLSTVSFVGPVGVLLLVWKCSMCPRPWAGKTKLKLPQMDPNGVSMWSFIVWLGPPSYSGKSSLGNCKTAICFQASCNCHSLMKRAGALKSRLSLKSGQTSLGKKVCRQRQQPRPGGFNVCPRWARHRTHSMGARPSNSTSVWPDNFSKKRSSASPAAAMGLSSNSSQPTPIVFLKRRQESSDPSFWTRLKWIRRSAESAGAEKHLLCFYPCAVNAFDVFYATWLTYDSKSFKSVAWITHMFHTTELFGDIWWLISYRSCNIAKVETHLCTELITASFCMLLSLTCRWGSGMAYFWQLGCGGCRSKAYQSGMPTQKNTSDQYWLNGAWDAGPRRKVELSDHIIKSCMVSVTIASIIPLSASSCADIEHTAFYDTKGATRQNTDSDPAKLSKAAVIGTLAMSTLCLLVVFWNCSRFTEVMFVLTLGITG